MSISDTAANAWAGSRSAAGGRIAKLSRRRPKAESTAPSRVPGRWSRHRPLRRRRPQSQSEASPRPERRRRCQLPARSSSTWECPPEGPAARQGIGPHPDGNPLFSNRQPAAKKRPRPRTMSVVTVKLRRCRRPRRVGRRRRGEGDGDQWPSQARAGACRSRPLRACEALPRR